jgi:diguanylate cyclase (GGDEF)-like protein
LNSPRTRAVLSFVVPAGVALLAVALALHTGAFPLTAKLVDYYSGAVFALALLLAWRFRSSRMAIAVASLALAQRGLLAVGISDLNVTWVAICMTSCLLPANFLLLALTPERGFRGAPLMFWSVLLTLESGAVAGVCNADDRNFQALFTARLVGGLHVPMLALGIFFLAAGVLVGRYVVRRRPVDAGLVWSLAAALLGFQSGGVTRMAAVYLGTGGLVLVLALLEASYFMAYHDELTGLPARRAFNEELQGLEEQFCLAVVDIDLFKRFNDIYGHETGDQVLRMVASRLASVTGGGKAFRTGGEEFCVLFRRCSMRDALPHLDALRESVEASSFVLRGPDRPTRTADDRQRRSPRGAEVSVTVSIGAAQSPLHLIMVDEVLRAADKALYQAKAAGRNRVEVYRPSRRKAKEAAAEA